jgi:hypothetical protein
MRRGRKGVFNAETQRAQRKMESRDEKRLRKSDLENMGTEVNG